MPATKLVGAGLTIGLPLVMFLVLSSYQAKCDAFVIGGVRQLLDPSFKQTCELVVLGRWGALAGFVLAAGGWAYQLLRQQAE